MRAIKDQFDWGRVKRVLDGDGVPGWVRPAYWRFFKEINSKKIHDMDRDAQKIRIDEMKAKYEGQRLNRETLGKIAKLVPLNT
jgi:hypothetical protein